MVIAPGGANRGDGTPSNFGVLHLGLLEERGGLHEVGQTRDVPLEKLPIVDVCFS